MLSRRGTCEVLTPHLCLPARAAPWTSPPDAPQLLRPLAVSLLCALGHATSRARGELLARGGFAVILSALAVPVCPQTSFYTFVCQTSLL